MEEDILPSGTRGKIWFTDKHMHMLLQEFLAIQFPDTICPQCNLAYMFRNPVFPKKVFFYCSTVWLEMGASHSPPIQSLVHGNPDWGLLYHSNQSDFNHKWVFLVVMHGRQCNKTVLSYLPLYLLYVNPFTSLMRLESSVLWTLYARGED